MSKTKEYEPTDSDKKAAHERAERIASEIGDMFGRAGTPETWTAATAATIAKIEEVILSAFAGPTRFNAPVAPLTTRDGK